MQIHENFVNKIIIAFYKPILKKLPVDITPNDITFLGFVLGIFCIVLTTVVYHSPALLLWSSLIITFICDLLDGALARYRTQRTKLGKDLDTISDTIISLLLVSYLGFAWKIQFFAIFILLILILFRSWLLIKDKEIEIGGLRWTIILGSLIAIYYFKNQLQFWFLVLIIWNMLSILISFWKWKSIPTPTFDEIPDKIITKKIIFRNQK